MNTQRSIFLASGLLIAACQDLTVPNTNAPSTDDALSTPSNVETAIGSSFKQWWAAVSGDDMRQDVTHRPTIALSGIAGELTAVTLGQFDEAAQIPRMEYNNQDAGAWVNRLPYQQYLAAIAMSTDILRVLDDGMQLGTVDARYPNGQATHRGRMWAKFVQGLSHVYMGLYFDKSRVLTETEPLDAYSTDFRPYREVITHGINQLIEARTLAESDTFALASPTNWVNGFAYTSADMVKLINSFIARARVYGARTPAERAHAAGATGGGDPAGIDWNEILTLVNAGITAPGFSYSTGTKRGFIQQAEPNTDGTRSYYVVSAQLQTDARVSYFLLGPADTTGRYQTWLNTPIGQRAPFIIGTPDRRIHGAGASGATATGTVFRYLASQTMSSTLGTYLQSNYRSIKYGTVSDTGTRGVNSTMTPTEMDFLRAEAFIRLAQPANALTIINASRATGGLPAATATGVSGSSCVPRKPDGNCGDLWDVFMYEKRIATYATEATIPWADARGWGMLISGSLVHLPVPGRELTTLGMPYYSFGGTLPGSAP